MIARLCRWLADKFGYIAWRLQATAEIRERWWQTLESGDRTTIRLSALSSVIGITSLAAYCLGIALGGSSHGWAPGLMVSLSGGTFFAGMFLLATDRRGLNRRLRAIRNFYYAMGGLPPATEAGWEISQRRFDQQLNHWQNAAKEVWGNMAAITQRLERLRGVEPDDLPNAIREVSETETDLRIERENLGRIKRCLERHIWVATSPHLYLGVGVGLRVPEDIEGLVISLTSPTKK